MGNAFGLIKEKKSKLTDTELQANNDEAIKADVEAVSKSEKSLSQIAIDQADKRNGESKTIGKWTPELEAEYKKIGFEGSRGDYMKGKSEPIAVKPEDITPVAEVPKPTLEQIATKQVAEAIAPKEEPVPEQEATSKKRNIEDVANASKLPK